MVNYYRANKLAIRWAYKTWWWWEKMRRRWKRRISKRASKRVLLICILSLFLFLLLPATEASSSWLLWERWRNYSHPLPLQKDKEGRIKGLRTDKAPWSLKNAFDTRGQCIRALAIAPKEIQSMFELLEKDWLPEKRNKYQIMPGQVDINITLSMYQKIERVGKRQQFTNIYNFWCLPVGVDPKILGVAGEW